MNKILINKEIKDRKITKKFIKEAVFLILQNLNLDNVEISISLVDDETMRNLNREWRGKDKTTDVLSFPMEDEFGISKYRLLGDVIISLPYAEKQAKEIGYTIEEEIIRLLTHGILHLLGYDHETSEEDAKIMFDLQDKIFEKVVSVCRVPMKS
ncbi:rRNA maturation RNase YbeY [Venenivibrio stagnispumantis]|uniref:Endoribonuclease YbeY n=1 Tax=Venenivibrio stagnispumantis TaxID=407998 RepID=A0AA45WK96_9AQUI|nr:rRNA maturation RNase YbeY [Venenivibrio stagnispumantis]MCW4573525.1 rRNA maturation RNase YbeY [Venenivibrio stagnispumantis]SMP06143.1 probable rRNA maturation factor [Venenivibrio stagnispumantis]